MRIHNYKSVDSYIDAHAGEIAIRLKKMRAAVRKGAPKAEEGISYGMPGYKLHGALVYFAAFKKHIGFFPAPMTVNAFAKELKPYKTTKGTVQFRHDEPIPYALVTAMTKNRVVENTLKAEAKKKAKK